MILIAIRARKNGPFILAALACIIFIPLISALLAINLIDGGLFSFHYAHSLFFVIAGILLLSIGRNYASTPIHSIGYIYIAVIAAYLFVPTVKFILDGYYWNPRSDTRLAAMMPSQNDQLELLWYFIVYLISFGFAYLLTTSSEPKEAPALTVDNSMTSFFAVTFFVTLFVKYVVDIQLGVTGEYAQTSNTIAGQPLIVRQLYQLLASVKYGAAVFALVLLGINYAKRRFLFYFILLILVLPPILSFGSRHEAVTFAFLAVVIYHLNYRAISGRILLLLAIAALAVAFIVGTIRSFELGYAFDFSVSNEFEATYGTFYDNLVNASAIPPEGIYYSDFVALIPQQFLPFEKVNSGYWYMSEYMAEAFAENIESGYGFGVISEAAIGLGFIELVIKGLIVGFIFGKMANYYNSGRGGVVFYCIYLFCLATCFRSFRASSFELLRSVPFALGPSIVLYMVVSRLNRLTKRSGSRGLNAAVVPSPLK
jgi:hypothetical protein